MTETTEKQIEEIAKALANDDRIKDLLEQIEKGLMESEELSIRSDRLNERLRSAIQRRDRVEIPQEQEEVQPTERSTGRSYPSFFDVPIQFK